MLLRVFTQWMVEAHPGRVPKPGAVPRPSPILWYLLALFSSRAKTMGQPRKERATLMAGNRGALGGCWEGTRRTWEDLGGHWEELGGQWTQARAHPPLDSEPI